MRTSERWKDRVELSLDGRQVFFLFFGSAVLACLLFVAGVLVGRRIEHRGQAPLAGEDPLATLDQLDSTEPDDGLTFHESLVRPEGRADKKRDAGRLPARPLREAEPHGASAAPRKPDARKPERQEAAPRPRTEPPPAAGRYTLQLSSFAEQADAEELAARLRAGGVAVQVVESDVPGKGTFYRVRTGDYPTRQAAIEAKAEYERIHGTTALVAPM